MTNRGERDHNPVTIITDVGGGAVDWMTAIDRWTEWMRAAGTRAGTVALRRYQLMRFAETHLRRSPWRINTTELVEFLSGRDWKPETRRSYRAAVRSFYKWAKIVGHIKRDPSEALPTVTAPLVAPRPTPEHVLAAALAAADDRARLILLSAAYAGLRRAEIAIMRWERISETSLRVAGKGGRVRVVPTHPKLRRALDEEHRRRLAGGCGTGYRYNLGLATWVFPGQAGGPMTPQAIGKIAARALGGGWTAHTLRHRFASRAYAGTRDLVAVQELLGHAKPETTRRYTQLPDGALLAAVEAV